LEEDDKMDEEGRRKNNKKLNNWKWIKFKNK
jgi:hypothetical protein